MSSMLLLTRLLERVGRSQFSTTRTTSPRPSTSSPYVPTLPIPTQELTGRTYEQIMEKYDVTRVVYSSSATVYGVPQTIPIPETTRMAPESCYGRTKYMTELILKDLCDSKPDTWRAIGLRYFNPAGAHPSGQIGEDPRGKPGNLLPLLAQMATGVSLSV